MNDALLLVPPLFAAIVIGTVSYFGSDPGGVWGRGLPSLASGAAAFLFVGLVEALTLIVIWLFRTI